MSDAIEARELAADRETLARLILSRTAGRQFEGKSLCAYVQFERRADPRARMACLLAEEIMAFYKPRLAALRHQPSVDEARREAREEAWNPPNTLPTTEGARILALVESEMEWQDNPPSVGRRGYHRIGPADRIVGWKEHRALTPSPAGTGQDGERS